MQTLDMMPRDSELAMTGDSAADRVKEVARLWWKNHRIFMAVTTLCALPLLWAALVDSTLTRITLGGVMGVGGGLAAVALLAPTVCRRRRGLGHGLRHTVTVVLHRLPGLIGVGTLTLLTVTAPFSLAWLTIDGFSLGLTATVCALAVASLVAAYGGSRLLMAAPVMVAEEMGARASLQRSLIMTRGRALTIVMPALIFAGGCVVLAAALPGWMGLSGFLLMPLCLVGLSLAAVTLACTYMWLRGD